MTTDRTSSTIKLRVLCRIHGTEYGIEQPRTLHTNGVVKLVKAECRCSDDEIRLTLTDGIDDDD